MHFTFGWSLSPWVSVTWLQSYGSLWVDKSRASNDFTEGSQGCVLGPGDRSHLYVCHRFSRSQVSGLSLVVSAAHFLAPESEDFHVPRPAFPTLPLVILVHLLSPAFAGGFLFSLRSTSRFKTLSPSVVFTPVVRTSRSYRLVLWHLLMRPDVDTRKEHVPKEAIKSHFHQKVENLRGMKSSMWCFWEKRIVLASRTMLRRLLDS